MPAMTIPLTEFSDSVNSRTFVTTTHTVAKPRVVVQRRKVPNGNSVMLEDTITCVYGTTDSAGDMNPQKVSMEVKVRRPMDAHSDDIDGCLNLLRDIVQSTELETTIDTQKYLA